MTKSIARWWRRRQPRWLRNYQFPLVTRRWARQQGNTAFNNGRRVADEELARVKAALDPIIQKGTRIRAGIADTPLGETYRCQVDFDPFLFRQMFTFGNDQHAIRLVAERLAYRVEGEIMRMNWHRFAEDEEARRERRYFHTDHLTRQSNPFTGDDLPSSAPEWPCR